MESDKRSSFYKYLLYAAILFLGMSIGTFVTRMGTEFRLRNQTIQATGDHLFEALLSYINDNYVDTVNTEQLRNEAIESMLASLDPHSEFITAADYDDINDPLLGSFDGIGIQFRLENDTILVAQPVKNGPSERLGIQAGDRIVKVDGKNVGGIKLTNKDVMKMLKGPKGTTVKVSILRRGTKGLIDYTIKRDKIPTYSIDIAYLVRNGTGYIKLSKFSATTHEELHDALKDLKKQGAKKLILDLRDNGGGYLQEAIAVADEFLPDDQLIVYTEGLHRTKKSAYATSGGEWETEPLVVLIDEGSASASEIVAGAIQDNDRGTIVGRRSFGKGLVQEQVGITGGAALRLTTARYYTPVGRCIQKPYTHGKEEYLLEYFNRFTDGELLTIDSIKKNDSLKYKTPKGKIVYGGGGIIPDVFVGLDYDSTTTFFNESVNRGTLYQFTFSYVDKNRKQLTSQYSSVHSFDQTFTVSPALFSEFVEYAQKNGVKHTAAAAVARSEKKVKDLMKAYVARNLFDDKGFYPIYLKTDKTLQKALGELGSI